MDWQKLTNTVFQPEAFAQRLDAALREPMKQTARDGLTVTDTDLAVLRDSFAAARARLAEYERMALQVAEARRVNLLAYRGIKFISLGSNCFARSVATRWGIKPPAALGEATHPFDIAIHRIATIPTLIETDFAGYLDPGALQYLPDKGYVTHTKLGATFNHERGEEFYADNCALLVKKYSARIENFYRDIAAADRIVFLLYTNRWVPGITRGIERIYEALQKRFPDKDWGLAVLVGRQFEETAETAPLPGDERPRMGVTVQQMPLPKYSWHRNEHAFSPEGQAYERAMMDVLKAIIARIFPDTVAVA